MQAYLRKFSWIFYSFSFTNLVLTNKPYTNVVHHYDKAMRFKILTIILFAINLNSFGQNSELKDCYEIKYLDFFGLDQMEIIKWPESEINGLMKMDFDKDRGDSMIKTNFIIPMIVYQLK